MMCAALLLSFSTYFSLESALSGPGVLQYPFGGLLMLLKPGLPSALGHCSDTTNLLTKPPNIQPGMNPHGEQLHLQHVRAGHTWGCRTQVWSPWGSPDLPEVTLRTQPRCCCCPRNHSCPLPQPLLSVCPQEGNSAQNPPEAAQQGWISKNSQALWV